MRHTRGHTGNRRSHHALTEPRLSKCPNCNAMHLRHRICEACGQYKGKLVIDVASKTAKRLERRNARLKSFGQEVGKSADEETKEKVSEPKSKKSDKADKEA